MKKGDIIGNSEENIGMQRMQELFFRGRGADT